MAGAAWWRCGLVSLAATASHPRRGLSSTFYPFLFFKNVILCRLLQQMKDKNFLTAADERCLSFVEIHPCRLKTNENWPFTDENSHFRWFVADESLMCFAVVEYRC
jgi:hypothetical protein